ncbi:ABC transporter permease [Planctomycetota bacterium]
MVIVHGIDKHKFTAFRDYNLPPETLAAFQNQRNGALVGASVAKRKGWKAGEQIDLTTQIGFIFTINGIFLTENEEQDNTILVGFEFAQDTKDSRGTANLIYARVREGVRPEEVAAEIDSLPLPVRTRTQPEKNFMSAMLEDLNDMMNISRTVILITLIVAFAGIANAIAISVRDRTQQIGIMRTLGFLRRTIMAMILTESVIISLIGGITGVVGAMIVFQLQNITVQTRTYNFAISLNWMVMLAGLGVALLVGFIGGVLPAWQASRLKIIDSIRSVD